MGEIKEGIEEYYRRVIVKLIREAGTEIRKEMVKRHALTAEVNLSYVESLKKIIEEDYKLLSKPLEDILKESFERFKRGEDIGKVFEDWLTASLTTTLQAQFIRPLPIMLSHLESVNNFLKSVMNRIVEELNKEGIYLHPIEPVPLPTTSDITLVTSGLRDALYKIDMAIGILKGLIDASKES
jgi:hypothetical protein